jgi:hypothetical protein
VSASLAHDGSDVNRVGGAALYEASGDCVDGRDAAQHGSTAAQVAAPPRYHAHSRDAVLCVWAPLATVLTRCPHVAAPRLPLPLSHAAVATALAVLWPHHRVDVQPSAVLALCVISSLTRVDIPHRAAVDVRCRCTRRTHTHRHRRANSTLATNTARWETPSALIDSIFITAVYHTMSGWDLRVGVVAPTAPDQRAALVELYIATNGSSWSDRGGWLNHANGSDPCDNLWSGLVCTGGAGSTNRSVYVRRASSMLTSMARVPVFILCSLRHWGRVSETGAAVTVTVCSAVFGAGRR